MVVSHAHLAREERGPDGVAALRARPPRGQGVRVPRGAPQAPRRHGVTGAPDRARDARAVGLVDALDDRRDALAAADAQRREPALPAALAQLVSEGQREAGARRAERMPERDRAAVHIRSLAVEAEILLDGEV